MRCVIRVHILHLHFRIISIMRPHEACICLQNMDFIIGTSGEEIDFDAWEFPFSEVVGFELGVDADRPVCVIVVDAGVVEDAGLRNVVVFQAIGDGEVAEVDGIRVFAGVRKAEVGDGERFVGARD